MAVSAGVLLSILATTSGLHTVVRHARRGKELETPVYKIGGATNHGIHGHDDDSWDTEAKEWDDAYHEVQNEKEAEARTSDIEPLDMKPSDEMMMSYSANEVVEAIKNDELGHATEGQNIVMQKLVEAEEKAKASQANALAAEDGYDEAEAERQKIEEEKQLVQEEKERAEQDALAAKLQAARAEGVAQGWRDAAESEAIRYGKDFHDGSKFFP